jgi:predicted FMN-binding regulatory protein PaiB
LQGKAKLSQNKSAAERRRIAAALADAPSPTGRAVARCMEALERGEPPT